MFFEVTTLFTIFHLISTTYGMGCCESLNQKLPTGGGGNSALVLKDLEALALEVETIYRNLQSQESQMQKKLDELQETIFPTTTIDACEHLEIAFENYTRHADCKKPKKPMKDCTEAIEDADGESGVFEIRLTDGLIPTFEVYCLRTKPKEVDKQLDGSWMIIQRREDGSEPFYKDWKYYKQGFGNVYGEYFIGLDRLHLITTSTEHELWIKLVDFDGDVRWANYDSFEIGPETEGYAIKKIGRYTGIGPSSLSAKIGQKFTTRDHDNDEHANNCAVLHRGPWWHESCTKSNLNGEYLTAEYQTKDPTGVFWHEWHGDFYSLKYVHMAIRPLRHSQAMEIFK